MGSFDIRAAVDGDLDQIIGLYRHLNPDDPEIDGPTGSRVWERIINADLVEVLVAVSGGELIGSCMLTIIPNLTRGARAYALIENVVTRADCQRRGIGKALLAEALRRAGQADCYKVMLATGSRRESTLAFYESAGFTRNAKTFFEAKLGKSSPNS
jgi:GNAT superfamily N-acetyltransferase